MSQPRKLAILVGGGPAPGINSVIAVATIRAELDGIEVVGIRDGSGGSCRAMLSTLPP